MRDEANDRVTRARLAAALRDDGVTCALSGSAESAAAGSAVHRASVVAAARRASVSVRVPAVGGAVTEMSVDHVDVNGVALAPLRRALARAKRHERPAGRTSAAARGAASSAEVVLYARDAVRRRAWDTIDTAKLDEAVVAHGHTPGLEPNDAACAELTLVRRVCDARRAAAALRRAIANGAPRGVAGSLDLGPQVGGSHGVGVERSPSGRCRPARDRRHHVWSRASF